MKLFLGIPILQASFSSMELPNDIDPLFCHDSLLNCWEDQTRRNGSHLSLFWTICYAYGWPYMCLGLLKVLNDCLGFAGPLLLNMLIKYLQEGLLLCKYIICYSRSWAHRNWEF